MLNFSVSLDLETRTGVLTAHLTKWYICLLLWLFYFWAQKLVQQPYSKKCFTDRLSVWVGVFYTKLAVWVNVLVLVFIPVIDLSGVYPSTYVKMDNASPPPTPTFFNSITNSKPNLSEESTLEHTPAWQEIPKMTEPTLLVLLSSNHDHVFA